LHLGGKIKNAEHLHSIRRHRIFVVDHSNVSKPQGFDESKNDFAVGYGTMSFCRWWCGHKHQFFAADDSAAIANAL
jgi:hypothetical protein